MSASDAWLDIGDKQQVAQLPAEVVMPTTYAERLALAESCWIRLTGPQQTFLQAWRDHRFNARAAAMSLGLSGNTRPMTAGMGNPNFATVVRVWRANAAADATDRDRLLARQDDIVETLLTPKPVLHQGVPTGFEEVEAGAASRANEVLMRATGLFPREGAEVNVGVQVPAIVVELTSRKAEVVDAEVVEINTSVPQEAT